MSLHNLRRVGRLERLYFALKRKIFRTKVLEDPYLDLINAGVAGWPAPGNEYAFKYAIEHMPPNAAIVEIGSFCGQSVNAITHLKALSGHSGPVFSCDRWKLDWDPELGDILGAAQISQAEYEAYIREAYRRSTELFSRHNLPHHIEVFSDEFFDLWEKQSEVTDFFGRPTHLGGPIGFCFIDGNHSYDYAKRDFENTDRFLSPGGFVLFDDSMEGSGWDVCKVVKEVENNPSYRLVMKNPNYMFRKIHRQQHL